MAHPGILVAILAACWLASRMFPGRGEDRWESSIDVPLALAVALVVPVLATAWFAPFHLTAWPMTASDFEQYCVDTELVRLGTMEGWFVQRSVFAALLPGFASHVFGVLGGLIVGAWISFGVLALAVHLWARALMGRVAGVAAALLLLSCGPIVLLARTASFYPEIVASTVLCTAATTCALRWRTNTALALAGASVGWVLLVDPRGISTGLACGGLLALAALAARPMWIPIRLALLALPVGLSWWVASIWFPEGAMDLSSQVYAYVTDGVRHGAPGGAAAQTLIDPASTIPDPLQPGNGRVSPQFIWGHSSFARFLAMLEYVTTIGDHVPQALADTQSFVEARARHVDPWVLPVGGAAILVASHLVHRPWRLLALVGTALPAFLSLVAACQILPLPRFLTQGAILAPLMMGLAVGTAVGPRPRKPIALATLGLLTALVFGIAGSWLSPTAEWRWPIPANREPKSFQLGEEEEGRCVGILARDRDEGMWQPFDTLSDGSPEVVPSP